MKWYETPLTVLLDNAIFFLNEGREAQFHKTMFRMHALVKEREKQMRTDLDITSVLSRYQGIDTLLHMEQSKLRVMTDEDLSISRMGLICDCAALLDSVKPTRKQDLARARQALDKILREITRRMNVYGINYDYWGSAIYMHLSEEDKKEFQMMRLEILVKRDLHALLIASASAYHNIPDKDLFGYLNGAARYRREMSLYYQVICRLRRECMRRAKARYAADPFPHAVPC